MESQHLTKPNQAKPTSNQTKPSKANIKLFPVKFSKTLEKIFACPTFLHWKKIFFIRYYMQHKGV
jgi:hypothetical protein